MNAFARIQLPRWPKVFSALIWELIWKNRLVLPALLLALGLGAGLALAVGQAPPDAWWDKYARGTGFVAFLGSILLAFAPFTLMDSHGSWRMNSVTTRWSVLPTRTVALVTVPLLVAWLVIALLVSAWTPILHRLIHGIDMAYVLVVFLSGAVACQTLAWAIPRKPSQFWVLAALLFLSLLLGVIVPQESPVWPEIRVRAMISLAVASAGLTCLAIWAAGRNRCGDWPGEIPLSWFTGRSRGWAARTGVFRKPVAALFCSEVLPGLRAFLLSWVILVLLLVVWGCLVFWLRRPGVHIDWLTLALGMVIEAMPNLGVLWLMAWGLFLGCEPGMGFQTRLSGFRSTRPLTVGMLAGTRLSGLALIWLCVWVPLLALQKLLLYAPIPPSDAVGFSKMAADFTAGRMAFSASVVIGAFPVLLRGRLEGFPTLFLATLVAWCWSCVLGSFAYQKEPMAWVGLALSGLVATKFLSAAGLLFWSHRQGYVTWHFPAVVLGSWLLVVGGMFWLFRPWHDWGLASALAPVVMIPLVRLAACPLAMAANRHQ